MTASTCSTAIGLRSRRRPRAQSSCSTAATSIPAAWRISPTSSICPTSPCSPGTRAVMAARPVSAASARASARRCATSTPSCGTLRRATAIPVESMAVIAQSVGAVLVSIWAHDYAPKIRCMVLASPAFKVKLYVPFARTGLALQHKLRGHFFVNSYVKPQFLTHDPERIASYRSDPLITRPIAVNILLGLYEASERVVADARAITVPTQLLISGADWVVHHGPQHRFYERLGTPIKERHVLPGFYHDTLGELGRSVAVTRARRFILDRFAEPPSRPVAARRRPQRLHPRRGRRAGLAAAADVAARTLLGARPAQYADRRPGVGRASRSATAPASIPARPSTTSTATSRAERGPSAASSTATISNRSAGAASVSASSTSRSSCARA